MSAIDRLMTNYSRQVNLPWAANLSGKQRIWFAVYPPADERRIRAHLPQFEALTLEARHGWASVDLTRLLPEWVTAHKHREAIFEKPEHFKTGTKLEIVAAQKIKDICADEEMDESAVVAVVGLASLFDFMRISTLIESVEDSVRGRLLVMFPGEYQRNIYRFMDARDGFNYMAVPITSNENFINP